MVNLTFTALRGNYVDITFNHWYDNTWIKIFSYRMHLHPSLRYSIQEQS